MERAFAEVPKPRHHARKFVGVIGGAALLLSFICVSVAGAAPDSHKVTLCHATDSASNPYVAVTVDYHSVTNGGHGNHDGPVFSADLAQHAKWGDIIPAFDFGPDARYAGLNWTADTQAALDNGCVVGPTPTTTTTGPVG